MQRTHFLAERRLDAELTITAEAAEALESGSVGDPFSLLGPQAIGGDVVIRAYVPPAEAVEIIDAQDQLVASMLPIEPPGLFAARVSSRSPYRLRIRWPGGVTQITEDPYSFGLLLGELDVYLLAEGNHLELGRCLGAQAMTIDGVAGVRFAVWAPNARRVSVVGDFNGWDGRRHTMRKRVEAGVWELFIPRLPVGTIYKYEILGPFGLLPLKSDPVALQVETPPRTASVVADPTPFVWTDGEWLKVRASSGQHLHAPVSIYEVHAGSWRRRPHDGAALNWDELAEQLIPYVKDLGFTHIELLPIMEHPFGGSWGYQVLGQYAPHAAFGEPQAFARFVDRCHNAGLGVILDWVPGHFPTDAHGLAYFDGTALYEHTDPREGFHQEWNTAIYNLGRRRGALFSDLERPALDRALPRRWPARRCGRIDAVSRLRPRGGAVDPESLRRPREPRGHRFPAASERRRGGAIPGHDDDRRGIHRLAGGDAALA